MQILGRAKELREFIKHGKEKATIEIELYNTKGRNLVVKRTLRQDNKSDWMLNGECMQCAIGLKYKPLREWIDLFLLLLKKKGHVVKKPKIIQTMKNLNVQVDNLCQFLPQDRFPFFQFDSSYCLDAIKHNLFYASPYRVCHFAELTPPKLLRETEVAVGSADMLQKHDKYLPSIIVEKREP